MKREGRTVGKCAMCHLPYVGEFIACDSCRKKISDRTAKCRAKKKIKGLCYSCSSPARSGKLTCAKCAHQENIRKNEQRKRLKKQVEELRRG